jgi:hypothetical protein
VDYEINVAAVTEKLLDFRGALNSLDRPVAFGIKGISNKGRDPWFVIGLSAGRIETVQFRSCGAMVDIDAELDVAIVVQATLSHWLEIGQGDFGTVIDAADRKIIAISGKLPYFIRHVRSTVEVIYAFGLALR